MNYADFSYSRRQKKVYVPFPFRATVFTVSVPLRFKRTFLTRCKHARQNGKLRSVSPLLNAKCESLNAMHRMRTVCDKWRDNLDGREDRVVGKSSPTRRPQREKREDAYYFCHVPQNILSRPLGVK